MQVLNGCSQLVNYDTKRKRHAELRQKLALAPVNESID